MKLTKSVRRWATLPAALVLLLTLVMLPTPVLADPAVPIGAEGAYNSDFSKGPFDTVDEGAEFWVKINVGSSGDPLTDFDAADYLITYDTSVLSVDLTLVSDHYEVTSGHIANGDIGASGPTGTPNVPVVQTREIGAHGSGVIKVVNNVAGYTGLDGYGYLCAIKFTVTGSDGNDGNITPSQVTLSDTGANEIATETPTAETINVDKLEVTGISVVGEGATNEGYVSDGDTTTFTMTATVTGGCAAFTGATPYDWAFDTGGSGTDPSSSATVNDVTYSSSDTKNITVTVTDDLGSTSVMASSPTGCVAKVYNTFTFSFTQDRTEGIKGDTRATHDNTIAFDSTAGEGKSPYTYAWDFDGGSGTTTDADPDVTFTPSGTRTGDTYTVGVTGSDDLTAEITPATHDIHIYQLGDVNKDNIVKATDITESELIVGGVGGHDQTFTSDVNMDGASTSADTTATEIAVAEAY